MNLLTFLMILLINKLTMQQDALKVFHLSRFHSRFESSVNPATKETGYGIARIAHYIKEQKDNYKSTIVIDAMDWFKGSIWYSVHRTNICLAFLKLLPIDVLALGEEETNTARLVEDRTRNFTNYIKR